MEKLIKLNGFPAFMKNACNRVPANQQNTSDIEGYYYEGKDDSQVAFWTCNADRVSKKHTHEFDEYMICVSGRYTVYLKDATHILEAGDEILIPAGTEQWGECTAGTRTIHVFGGKRIVASDH